MNRLLKFLALLLPKGSLFPSSIALLKAALEIKDWRGYERHVCSRSNCKGHYWGYLPKRAWKLHEHDKCPLCKGDGFKCIYQSKKKELAPVSWYIDLKTEEVIKEDFMGDPVFVDTYERASRDPEDGSYYGSPEHIRRRDAYDGARLDSGGGFDAKSTGHNELLTDAGQPYKSVQHSTNLVALRCSSLSPFDKCKSLNMHPIIIVPGPSQPANQRPFLLRTFSVFQNFGLVSEGLILPRLDFGKESYMVLSNVAESSTAV